MPFDHSLLAIANTLGTVLPSAVTGAVAGYYGGRFAERAKRTDRIQEDHLAELKTELLEVLRTRLNHYYLPIAEEQTGALEVTVVQVNKPGASIAENKYVRSEDKLQIIPIRTSDSDFMRGTPAVRMHSPSFDRLLIDAKEKHYSDLLESWGKMAASFQEAVQRHLAYAEHVNAALQKSLTLPPGRVTSINEPYANYERLALFIYGHHLETHPSHLLIDPNESTEIRSSNSGDRHVRCASKSDAEKALKSINQIAEETATAAPFIGAFNELLPDLRVLKNQLESAIHSKELPAKCRYTR